MNLVRAEAAAISIGGCGSGHPHPFTPRRRDTPNEPTDDSAGSRHIITLVAFLAVFVSCNWLIGGATFGYQYGWFAALGIGLAAWFVGLYFGASVAFHHEELSERCRNLATRRPRLGAALGFVEGFAFLVVSIALLVGPLALTVLTRPL